MFHVSSRDFFFANRVFASGNQKGLGAETKVTPRVAIGVCAVCMWFLIGLTVHGETVQDFEGPNPTFSSVQQADCQYRFFFHGRVNNERRSGLQSESMAYELGRVGSELFIVHDIPNAKVIRELTPSLFVKATKPGVRLFVRAVFPRTIVEGPEGGPLKALIPGPSYTMVNQWQHLDFANMSFDMKQLVEDQTRKLRRKLTQPIDERDVYIDQIVINLFTSSGRTNVWFDDLQVNGFVSADQTSLHNSSHATEGSSGHASDAAQIAATRAPSIPARRNGSVLEVDGDAFFARAIQYQGERLEFLAELGFNTIVFSNPAPRDKLLKASELGLWVVCPPPASFESEPNPKVYERVIAWNMGRRLDRNLLELTRQQAVRLRNAAPQWHRPLFGQINTGVWEYSRILDIVNVGQSVVGTGFDLADYRQWLAQKSQLAQGGTLIWPVIQTGSTPQQMRQTVSMSTRGVRWNVDPQIMRYLAYTSIAVGARGVFYASHERLDSNDDVSTVRSKTIHWLNQQLVKLAPWAAGGTSLGQATSTDPEVHVAAIKTRGTRLLIATSKSVDLVQPPFVPRTTFFIDDGHASRSATAYEINESGIVPLIYSQQHNGLRIKVDGVGLAEAIVVTDDPLAIQFLQRESLREVRLSTMGLHRELTGTRQKAHLVMQSELAANARTNHRALEFSRLSLEKYSHAKQAMDTGHNDLASDLLTQADLYLLASKQSSIEAAITAFPTNTASPLCMQMETLPLHWQMADRLKNSRFSLNALPASNFEDLNHMRSTGWQYHESPIQSLWTNVELSGEENRQGRYSLRLQAKSTRPEGEPVGTIELAPIWVTTAPIQVRQGQIFRVSGWVKVPKKIEGSVDGMMIIDSQSGPIYASYFRETEDWQPFSLYRGVAADGQLTVTFALTGVGEAFVDDVSIQIAEPLSPSSVRNETQVERRLENVELGRSTRMQPMRPLNR